MQQWSTGKSRWEIWELVADLHRYGNVEGRMSHSAKAFGSFGAKAEKGEGRRAAGHVPEQRMVESLIVLHGGGIAHGSEENDGHDVPQKRRIVGQIRSLADERICRMLALQHTCFECDVAGLLIGIALK